MLVCKCTPNAICLLCRDVIMLRQITERLQGRGASPELVKAIQDVTETLTGALNVMPSQSSARCFRINGLTPGPTTFEDLDSPNAQYLAP